MDIALKRARIDRNVRRVVLTFCGLLILGFFILIVFSLSSRTEEEQKAQLERIKQKVWGVPLVAFVSIGGISVYALLLFLGKRGRKYAPKTPPSEYFVHVPYSENELWRVLDEFEAVVDESWTEERLRYVKQRIVDWRPATLKDPDEELRKARKPRFENYDEPHPLNEELLSIDARLNKSSILDRMKYEILALPNEEQEALLRFFVLREVRGNDLKMQKKEREETAQKQRGKSLLQRLIELEKEDGRRTGSNAPL